MLICKSVIAYNYSFLKSICKVYILSLELCMIICMNINLYFCRFGYLQARSLFIIVIDYLIKINTQTINHNMQANKEQP